MSEPPVFRWEGASTEATPVGCGERGIDPGRLALLADRLREAHAAFQEERRAAPEAVTASLKGDRPLQYGWMDAPARWLANDGVELRRVQAAGDMLAERADAHLVLGI